MIASSRVAVLVLMGLTVSARDGLARDRSHHVQAYPFDIQRPVGGAHPQEAAAGDVVYREISFGRTAAFLERPLSDPGLPVRLAIDDPLFPIAFGKEKVEFFCAAKFGNLVVRGGRNVRTTICLRDRDGDQRFDESGVGVKNGMTLLYVSCCRSDQYADVGHDFIAASATARIEDVRPFPPTRYATRRTRPAAGQEGIVEIRFDGIDRGQAKFTASFRTAEESVPRHTATVSARLRRAGATRISLPHPLLDQPTFRMKGAKVAPVTVTMRVSAAAGGRAKVGIVQSFPAWVWYRERCGVAMDQAVTEPGSPPPRPPPADALSAACERASWREGGLLLTGEQGSLHGQGTR